MAHQPRRAYVRLLAFLLVGVAAFSCSSSEQSGSTATGGKGDGGSDGLALGGDNSTSNGGSTANGGASSGEVSTGSPAGTPCAEASDCESGKCEGGLCMPSVPLPNTTCETGPDCASGVCESGMCVIPDGASGSVDMTDCMAGTLGCKCQPKMKCQAGLTCTDGLCCNSATGSCEPGSGQIGEGGSNSGPPSACTPGFVGPVVTECGYPFASANPLTDILFNESSVLAAIVPSGGYPFASIQLFYNDEHAMTLGVSETVINGDSNLFPVSPLTKSPDIVDNPETGTNLIIGQLAGVDPVGRPMWPALFITDITNDARGVSGDWQWGGAPVNPTYVAGTWKGAVRIVDDMGASITPDADPAKNNQDYGNGHTAPAGSIVKAEGFGTEVRWDIRLEPGHNYRFQVMVHDGDQNKIGGDSGEACVTFCAGNECPVDVVPCETENDCGESHICSGGCCVPDFGGEGGAGNGGGDCPPGSTSYVDADGTKLCTPTDGGCPFGYVLTLRDGQQYCAPQQVK